jgi:C4-dicarboxylate transporter DctM subunit
MYRLVASPLLPSIPLFTLAGYFMVQGGATKRLLRVFTALFSWIPGGLAIATVAICTVFTFAGSGLTILSLGGLLVPMLIKTRYPENFSIGLLTSSGSLGLLFPTSIPAILYCVYSQTPLDRLFTGAILPELLMISPSPSSASAWASRAARCASRSRCAKRRGACGAPSGSSRCRPS